jgi:hypothetical protein
MTFSNEIVSCGKIKPKTFPRQYESSLTIFNLWTNF